MRAFLLGRFGVIRIGDGNGAATRGFGARIAQHGFTPLNRPAGPRPAGGRGRRRLIVSVSTPVGPDESGDAAASWGAPDHVGSTARRRTGHYAGLSGTTSLRAHRPADAT